MSLVSQYGQTWVPWRDDPAHAHKDRGPGRTRGGKESGPGSPLSRDGGNWQTRS